MRRKLDLAGDRAKSDKATPMASAIPALSKDHRELGVRSVSDLHLWNRAGWTGTGFTRSGPNHPPALALLFSDGEAARKIFERWRERFGSVDEQDEIYVAVVRGISPKEPAHYRVMITSRLASEADSSDGRHVLIPSRIQTMQAASDVNLNRFLESYRQAGAYLLALAIVKGDREPEFLFDVAVLKRKLSVRFASEIAEHDVEAVALVQALD